MENTRFSVTLVPEKKIYKDFGRIQTKKAKNNLIFGILFILLFAVNLVLAYAAGFSAVGTASITINYLMLFYWVFYGDFIGAAAYRSMNKNSRGMPVTYGFNDMGMGIMSELQNSAISYAAFTDIMENDNVFALYTSKNMAHVIPKNCFTRGTADEFREFISLAVGKPVKRVHTGGKTWIKVVICVLAFVLMFVGLIAADELGSSKGSEDTITLSKGGYSITLPADFEEDHLEDMYMGAFSDKVGLNVFRYSVTEDKDIIGEATHALGYLGNLVESWGLDRDNACMAPNGTVWAEYYYTYEEENTDWYYYDEVVLKDGYLWMTEFYCLDEDSDMFYGKFRDWAATAVIE